MKKTLLGVVAITMLLVALLATSVNAASVTANKEGEIVTVTVTTNETVESMEFVVNFDSTNFEFVKGSIKSSLTSIDSNDEIGEGKVMVSAFGGEASTLTLQFRAKANVRGAFTLSDTEFSNDEAMSNPTAIIEATTSPVIPTPDDDKKPGEDVGRPNEGENNNQEEVNNPTTEANEGTEATETTEEFVDEEGKKITKIPQTGAYMPTVVLGMSVLGIAFIAGYKMIKNK